MLGPGAPAKAGPATNILEQRLGPAGDERLGLIIAPILSTPTGCARQGDRLVSGASTVPCTGAAVRSGDQLAAAPGDSPGCSSSTSRTSCTSSPRQCEWRNVREGPNARGTPVSAEALAGSLRPSKDSLPSSSGQRLPFHRAGTAARQGGGATSSACRGSWGMRYALKFAKGCTAPSQMGADSHKLRLGRAEIALEGLPDAAVTRFFSRADANATPAGQT